MQWTDFERKELNFGYLCANDSAMIEIAGKVLVELVDLEKNCRTVELKETKQVDNRC
jgi:hypothetical protein